jgi:hypothetical protein
VGQELERQNRMRREEDREGEEDRKTGMPLSSLMY